jgi:hypothetical protein
MISLFQSCRSRYEINPMHLALSRLTEKSEQNEKLENEDRPGDHDGRVTYRRPRPLPLRPFRHLPVARYR